MSKLIQQFILQDWSEEKETISENTDTPIDNSCLSEEIHHIQTITATQENTEPLKDNTITHTAEEIETIKLKAYEEGYNKAIDELTNKQNSTIDTTLTKISEQLESILNQNFEYTQTHLNIINKIALEIAKKANNNCLSEKSTVQKIAKYTDQIIKLLPNHTHLTIKINPKIAEQFKDYLKELSTINTQLLTIETDHTILKEDYRIEWKQGYIEYNQDQLFKEIEKTILKIK
ncbi:flagellar assembly protein H [Rickettsiales bacterium Ac37b]|nr:flagellar assembly protein H [Rickettsiales bacterium Ac37b]